MSKASEWLEEVRRLRQQRDLAQGVLREALHKRPTFMDAHVPIARVGKGGECRLLRSCSLSETKALELAFWIADTFLDPPAEAREILRRIRVKA